MAIENQPHDISLHLLKQQIDFFKHNSLYLMVRNNEIVDISPGLLSVLEYPSKEDGPQWLPELLPKEFPREFLVYHRLFSENKPHENYDMKLVGYKQKIVTIRFSAKQLTCWNDETVAMLIGEDVTYQQKKLDDLSDSSSLFLFNPYAIAITSSDGTIEKINPKFMKKTQFNKDEIIGHNIFDYKNVPNTEKEDILNIITHQKDFRAEVKSKQKDGSIYDEDLYVIPVYNYGELERILFIGEDISNQKRVIHNLEQKAYYDDLSGFYRKEIGQSLLYEICDSSQNFGLFFLDYRDLKRFIDKYGHEIGDAIISDGSKRLKKALRQQDIMIRWGADEFVLIAPNLNDMKDMDVIANKIYDAFQLPFEFHDKKLELISDIGGCYCPTGSIAPIAREIITLAHENMSISKQGENLFCLSEYAQENSRSLKALEKRA